MSSRPLSAKKGSTEVPVQPPCKIHSLAIVAEKVQITGSQPVEIGENTVLHSYAKIVAEGGKVIIGKDCSISEKAVVGIADREEGDVVIGDGVNIETGATVEAKRVGDGTVIEAGARVGRGAVIGKYCKITPLEEVQANDELADFTVVYGNNRRRVDRTMRDNVEVREARQKAQMMQNELLKKLIPDFSAKWR